jgi:uncharacterized protein with FMN-binding domain
MRRAVSALVVTVVVTVLLVNFHTRPALSIHAATPAARPAASSPSSGSSGNGNGSAAATTPKRTAAKSRTIIGPAVQTQYGTVQVAVTVKGSRLRDVRALVLPSGSGRTNEISVEAGPLLRQEAMAAQSANIDTLSGASYTSDGYRRSLQAALDRAHA